jgi:transcriptional regulator with XRE-family HTH domain
VLTDSAKQRSEFADFLKFLRKRIDPDVRDLGPYARVSARLGKRVTQEELAEAIGVTREWCGMLESAATIRTSTGLLDRLADALMVTPDERARLFYLALPEVRRVHLRDDSLAVLEGFSRLRVFLKRLWAATSVDDVFTTATLQITDWFESAVLVHTTRRSESGLWELPTADDKPDRNIASKVMEEMRNQFPTPGAIDALNLYPRLANAGDVGTSDLYPPVIRRELLNVYARRRLAGFTFVKARVRSRTGVIGSFCIWCELGRSYSALDHAVLGAFAELASLALS